MKYLDFTFSDPASNLACDEALLELCEGDEEDGLLRVWEPDHYFVVLGYSNKVASEVNVTACEAKGIPIFRRFSGGGTVLQGPGCLNYSLVLRNERLGIPADLTASYRFVPGPRPEVLRRSKRGNCSDPGNQRSSTGGTEIFGQCPAPETSLQPVSWELFCLISR